ncbi:MAG: NAD-dependent epimerase/dehydratase family protein [Bacteroidetes bacterium]|nr:NAD-dependent epimerase/dehydratase family protein [Bacteroidota bacterium]MBS1757261.1 NAD-dependent epimerase/dehydratase family protein [Bacteroidota bacterium]
MKVTVTGGTGFIGNHVVEALLSQSVEVTVTGTNPSKAKEFSWYHQVHFIPLNLENPISESVLKEIASTNKLIHLAWAGLPNYKSLFHFEKNLLPQYFFLKELVRLGMKDITVTGTCFEYGMKEGALSANMPTDPQNPYALAKDSLRKFLQQLQQHESFRLKWLRLFYMFGKGQSEKSILSQLEKALKNKDEVFNMSGGEQQRDYLPVEEVAAQIVQYCLDDDKNGIFNVCSGKPVSISKLVDDYLAAHNGNIRLNKGYYLYPDYEPMNFWGVK